MHSFSYLVTPVELSDLDKLPWKRTVLTRFGEGILFDDCESLFLSKYNEALEIIINSVKERFDQPGYGMHKNLQDVIIKSILKECYDDRVPQKN